MLHGFQPRWVGESSYSVGARVGKGSYGVVVSAREVSTGRKVAIKHINKVFADRLDAVRIIREVLLARALCHPSIVTVNTVLVPDHPRSFDEVFIVTEVSGK